MKFFAAALIATLAMGLHLNEDGIDSTELEQSTADFENLQPEDIDSEFKDGADGEKKKRGGSESDGDKKPKRKGGDGEEDGDKPEGDDGDKKRKGGDGEGEQEDDVFAQMEPQGGDISMSGADFDMYFYFEGERNGTSLAQTAAQMEPQGGSINMQDADFNMYFYFEGERSNSTSLAQTAA